MRYETSHIKHWSLEQIQALIDSGEIEIVTPFQKLRNTLTAEIYLVKWDKTGVWLNEVQTG